MWRTILITKRINGGMSKAENRITLRLAPANAAINEITVLEIV
jgi:hypothetical protein